MPRGVKKENLPHKICVVCNRPFNWRKKWERCWDEVTTCSKSCNRKRRDSKVMRREMSSYNDDNKPSKNDDDKTGDITTASLANNIGGDHLGTSKCFSSSKDEVIPEVEKIKMQNNDDECNEKETETEDIDDVNSIASFEESFPLSTLQEALLEMNNDDNNDTGDVDDGNVNTIIQGGNGDIDDPVACRKAERKAMKKAKKAERRAQREGRGDPTAGQKQCDMCSKSVDMLIRCTYDESLQWKMVCGKCWNTASGGVVDGDAKHPYYRYGGLWKNRRRK